MNLKKSFTITFWINIKKLSNEVSIISLANSNINNELLIFHNRLFLKSNT